MKKKLPIGIQSFQEIRQGNYYYVDKTYYVSKLTDEGKYYFLSRPRRFGKSLFIDTLKQAFLGRKELFKGLYLEQNWDWNKTYPVIHIDFGGRMIQPEETKYLESWIISQLELAEQELKVECKRKGDYAGFFEELIRKASDKYGQRVVVLVDEYDKPILDRIDEPDEAKRVRDKLKNFYSVLKPLDAYLKFVLLTGVSKFSKVTLFSGLNQLNDITLSSKYATICGYTQSELERVFSEELEGEDLEILKCWYNGYSFMGEPVYNPFDVLLYLDKREYRPYWFETGTPEFLVKLLLKKRFYFPQMENIIAGDLLLGSFDVDRIEPETLLFQTGYLTIKDYERAPDGLVYFLSYPNKEIKITLNRYIAGFLTDEAQEVSRWSYELRKGLSSGDVGAIERSLRSLFSSIPYDWFRKNDIDRYEGYYASVVYSFLVGAGFEVVAEDYTSRGRIDLTLKYDDKAYVIEFKVIESEGESPKAIEHLRSRRYEDKYLGISKEVYLVGIDFSREQRNIVNFEWSRENKLEI